MDDWLQSVDTEHAALQLANDVKEIHESGGFEMRKWISNSSKVMEALGADGDASKNLDISSEVLTEKVLGMWWSVSDDTFTYSLRFNKGDKEVLSGNKAPTKRQLLRIVMSVYDPLGMLSHFMAYPKILLQLIWRKGTAVGMMKSQRIYKFFGTNGLNYFQKLRKFEFHDSILRMPSKIVTSRRYSFTFSLMAAKRVMQQQGT